MHDLNIWDLEGGQLGGTLVSPVLSMAGLYEGRGIHRNTKASQMICLKSP